MSVAPDGTQVTYDPIYPAISGDGKRRGLLGRTVLSCRLRTTLSNEQVYVRDLA